MFAAKDTIQSYDDEGPLWSDKRRMASEPIDRATVFIGSSGSNSTWISKHGNRSPATMLFSWPVWGSTPIPVLEDLANDPAFKGKLIVDVTEPLFFSTSGDNQWRPRKNLKYYKDETPAQWASFKLKPVTGIAICFLDKDRLSLNAMLTGCRSPTGRVFDHSRYSWLISEG